MSGTLATVVVAVVAALGTVLVAYLTMRGQRQTAKLSSEQAGLSTLLDGLERRLASEEERCNGLEAKLADTNGKFDLYRGEVREHQVTLVRLVRALAAGNITGPDALRELEALSWLAW